VAAAHHVESPRPESPECRRPGTSPARASWQGRDIQHDVDDHVCRDAAAGRNGGGSTVTASPRGPVTHRAGPTGPVTTGGRSPTGRSRSGGNGARAAGRAPDRSASQVPRRPRPAAGRSPGRPCGGAALGQRRRAVTTPPPIAPAIAAMVSQSPAEGRGRACRPATDRPGWPRARAKRGLARTPARPGWSRRGVYTADAAASGASPATQLRGPGDGGRRTSAAATQCPRPAARSARGSGGGDRVRHRGPADPGADRGPATRGRPRPGPPPVLCVTRLASTTRSTSTSRSAHGVAMADRRDPHGPRRLVAPSRPARSMVRPGQQLGYGPALRGRAEQVQRAPARAPTPPTRAAAGLARPGSTRPPPLDQQPGDQQRLLGVVGDRSPRASPAASGWSGGAGSKPPSSPAVPGHDLRSRQRLASACPQRVAPPARPVHRPGRAGTGLCFHNICRRMGTVSPPLRNAARLPPSRDAPGPPPGRIRPGHRPGRDVGKAGHPRSAGPYKPQDRERLGVALVA